MRTQEKITARKIGQIDAVLSCVILALLSFLNWRVFQPTDVIFIFALSVLVGWAGSIVSKYAMATPLQKYRAIGKSILFSTAFIAFVQALRFPYDFMHKDDYYKTCSVCAGAGPLSIELPWESRFWVRYLDSLPNIITLGIMFGFITFFISLAVISTTKSKSNNRQ